MSNSNWTDKDMDAPTIVDSTDESPGDILGRIDQYEILEELGTGGFGSVYRARDKVSRTFVAVKGLPAQVKDSEDEMANIRDNFALVSKLFHPNIAAALVLHQAAEVDYDDDELARKLNVRPGQTLMVMQYAPGVTLTKWRRQFPGGKVPLDKAIEVTRQIAAAIDFAHKNKIIHRDVKPSNVMVETQPNGSFTARVLDFGLAAEVRSSMNRTSQGGVTDKSGTRQYMAPEQWKGKRQAAATDQYALAALFYELITGAIPFASAFECGDAVVMLTAVTTQEPDIPADLPKPVRLALAKSLAKTPEERFATCADFVAALEGKRIGGETSFPLKKAAIIAGIAATVLAGGIWGWQVNQQRQAEEHAKIIAIQEQERKIKEENERLAAEKAEKERQAKAEAERLAAEQKAERERKAKAEAERLAAEQKRLADEAEAKRKAEEEKRAREAEIKRRVAEELAKKQEEERQRKAEVERQAAEQARAEQERLAKLRSANGLYKVIDLTDGTVTHLDAVPSGGWSDEYKTTKLVMRRIEAGSFTMGSPVSEEGRDDDETQHRVTLTEPYYIGVFEVTQGQWNRVMGNNPSHFSGLTRPVEKVSWDDCQSFCRKAGQSFRLPTEVEWEYACRAGTTTAYSWGSSLNGDKANCDGNYPCGTKVNGPYLQETRPVGSYESNDWGLYDMHGNVYEWCSDWYGSYHGDETDPTGPTSGGFRVSRGGSWVIHARRCRSASRLRRAPGLRYDFLGFRLCCSAGPSR